MILKIFKKFKEILNLVLAKLFGVQISRIKSIKNNKKAISVFKACSLKKFDKGGYYYLDPMPSIVELNEYYSSIYWSSRDKKKKGVNLRDLMHFDLLKRSIPEFFSNNSKCVVNFGAGHGGISILFWLAGFEVINIEPSGLPKLYEKRWKTYKSIDKVPEGTVDLIYGSHSLEHVQNIDKFKYQVNRVLNSNALLFWEVPNAKCPDCGPLNNRIDIPHTYYFWTDFFEIWFDEVILNECFDQNHNKGIIENWKDFKNPKGSVIRSLGRML